MAKTDELQEVLDWMVEPAEKDELHDVESRNVKTNRENWYYRTALLFRSETE